MLSIFVSEESRNNSKLQFVLLLFCDESSQTRFVGFEPNRIFKLELKLCFFFSISCFCNQFLALQQQSLNATSILQKKLLVVNLLQKGYQCKNRRSVRGSIFPKFLHFSVQYKIILNKIIFEKRNFKHHFFKIGNQKHSVFLLSSV